MTNKEIIDLYEGLAELYDVKVNLNIKTKYLLAKIKVQIEPLYKAIMVTRQDLIKKYGTEENESLIIKNTVLPQFSIELDELMNIESDINVPRINLDELNDQRIGINLIEKLLPIIND